MKKILFLLIILIYSCKSETKSESEPKFESTYGMYSILINEFVGASFHMEKEIQEQINYLNHDSTIHSNLIAYDNQTKEYIAYLDSLNDQLVNDSNIEAASNNQQILADIQHTNKLFFKEGKYSLKGIEYIEKTDSYRKAILQFINNQNLTERIERTLDTKDIMDRDGNSIKSLDYFFKDQSLIGTIAYLKNRKKNVLEFEKEFLNSKKLNE